MPVIQRCKNQAQVHPRETFSNQLLLNPILISPFAATSPLRISSLKLRHLPLYTKTIKKIESRQRPFSALFSSKESQLKIKNAIKEKRLSQATSIGLIKRFTRLEARAFRSK
jgi:hypothetical protein